MVSRVQALIVAFTFLFGLGGRTQYMYAFLLTIISLNALVLCQITKFTCLFCGEEGSPHYYAARVLSISLGCFAPMLVKPIPCRMSHLPCLALHRHSCWQCDTVLLVQVTSLKCSSVLAATEGTALSEEVYFLQASFRSTVEACV